MTTKRMKSREVRDSWRETLRHVEDGGEVVVIHYNRPIARIVPIEESTMTSRYIEDYKHRDLIAVAIGIADDGQYAPRGEYFAPTTREGLTKAKRGLLDDGLIELVPIPGRDDRALLKLTGQGKAKVRELDVAEVDEAIAAHNSEHGRPKAGWYKVTGAEVLAYHAS